MPEDTSGSNPSPTPGESPGGKPMGFWGITLVTVYLVFVAIVVFHSLVVLWPPLRNDKTTEMSDRLARIEKAIAAKSGTTGPLTSDLMGSDLSSSDLTSDLLGSDLTSESSETPALGTDLAPDDVDKPQKTTLDWKECGPGGQLPVRLFWLDFCLGDEERLFLIVMFAGALGGLVHALRSFFWYAGCRKLVLSWAGFYITLPVLGAAMATIFYLVVRGGFFSPQSSISDTSPFGFAAMAVLIGMFTEQAAMKLKEILETFLADAPKGTDHAGPDKTALTVSAVDPAQGPQAVVTPVTIKGKGFAQGAGVTFGGQPATDVTVAADGASLTANTPTAAAAGAVTVEVTNSNGKKGSLASGFTYV
jgi:hypothetical protein